MKNKKDMEHKYNPGEVVMLENQSLIPQFGLILYPGHKNKKPCYEIILNSRVKIGEKGIEQICFNGDRNSFSKQPRKISVSEEEVSPLRSEYEKLIKY